jgi:hypothetical protein
MQFVLCNDGVYSCMCHMQLKINCIQQLQKWKLSFNNKHYTQISFFSWLMYNHVEVLFLGCICHIIVKLSWDN